MRAFATGFIGFGLVTVPVKVYASTNSTSVQFSMITKGGHRVKMTKPEEVVSEQLISALATGAFVDAVDGSEVTFQECLKGYEYAKDQFVTFTAAELKALEAGTDKAIAIKEFVDDASIDPLLIEKTYLLGPDKGGDRGYALLSTMMSRLGQAAVAQWTSRNRDHLVVIRAYRGGLILQQCFF